MAQFVVPGALGSTDVKNPLLRRSDDSASQNKRDYMGQGRAPGAVGARDDGAQAATAAPVAGSNSRPHWGNDPSLKRIADTGENVKSWLRAALSNRNEHQTPGMWLALRRENGLDRHDNNLAAAERFAMAAEGYWDIFPGSQTMAIAGKGLLQKARMNVPGAEKLLGKAGSSNPDFTERWGQLGNSYHQFGLTPEAACQAALTYKFAP
jgi:hypothetical protein